MLVENSVATFEPSAKKVVLITGASGKVGREIARALARPGHALALHYFSNETEIRSLCGELETTGVKALPVRADLSIESGASVAVEAVRSGIGEIECLIHAAAPAIRETHPLDWTDGDYVRELEIHVLGFLRLCRLVLPPMLARQSGVIIPLLSTVLDAARPKMWCSYTTAKFALTGAAAGLATDLADTGLRVVGLMLGRVAGDDSPLVGVNAADAGVLARMICEDAELFPNGKTARLDGRTAKAGHIAFQGKDFPFDVSR